MAAPNPKDISIPKPPIDPFNLLDPLNLVSAGGSANDLVRGAKKVVSVADFLSDPVRLGEAFVGLLMIGIGISAALRGSSPTNTVKQYGQSGYRQYQGTQRRSAMAFKSSDAGIYAAAAQESARKSMIRKAAANAAKAAVVA